MFEPNVFNRSDARISACESGAQWQLVVAVLSERREARLEPNVISYSTWIGVCGKRGQWRRAVALVSET